MYEDQPSQLAQDTATALLWPNNPLGRPLAGTSDNIQRMKRRDLLNYRRKFYHAGNLCITVAGKTDLAEVKDLLRPLLRHFPTGPRAQFMPVSRRQNVPRFEVIASRSSRRNSSSACGAFRGTTRAVRPSG